MMLWDREPQLPYRAQVPWPKIYTRGCLDWVASVDMVQTWLDHSVGRHWCEWCWPTRAPTTYGMGMWCCFGFGTIGCGSAAIDY
jgi:hypothetical protein